MVAHLDTLGAMLKHLKPNGRLDVEPIGTWSSRFAEGARASIFSGQDNLFRGTILPLKASGHAYDKAVDTQPVGWDHVEVRVDEHSASRDDLLRLGIRAGDYVAVDPHLTQVTVRDPLHVVVSLNNFSVWKWRRHDCLLHEPIEQKAA